MAKRKYKINKYLKERQDYVDNNLTLQQVADKYDVSVYTLQNVRVREKWDLLRESKSKDIVRARNGLLYGVKGQSLDFYQSIMDRCQEVVDEDEEISGKEIKLIAETYKLCMRDMMILSKEQLEEVKKVEIVDSSLFGKLTKAIQEDEEA